MCLERGADLHMAQRIPLPLTVSCFSKIQIGFTFLVPGRPGLRAVKQVCVCLYFMLITTTVVHSGFSWKPSGFPRSCAYRRTLHVRRTKTSPPTFCYRKTQTTTAGYRHRRAELTCWLYSMRTVLFVADLRTEFVPLLLSVGQSIPASSLIWLLLAANKRSVRTA